MTSLLEHTPTGGWPHCCWLCALVLAPGRHPSWAQPTVTASSALAAFRAVLVKFDELADAETDLDRLRALEVERGRELARVLGEGLRLEGWRLILTAPEATPMGGLFLRLHDAPLRPHAPDRDLT